MSRKKTMRLHYEKCNFCGSENSTLLFTGPDLLTNMEGIFHVVRCDNCSLLRQDPRLNWDSLKDYYPKDYIAHSLQCGNLDDNIKGKLERYGVVKKVKLMKKYCASGNLLDIGCGTGRFLEEAQRMGDWKLTGIEPNSYAAQHTTSNLGINVINERWEDIESLSEQFDVITMWDVLEHLYFPVNGLQKIGALLKPNGVLIFSIPNLNSWDALVFNKHWIGYDLPRHLYFFDKNSVKQILEKCNLRIVNSLIISSSYNSIKNDLLFLQRQTNSAFLKILIKIYRNFLTRLILLVPLKVLDILKINPVITYIVKKI